MFEVVAVGRPGWFNVTVTLRAVAKMSHEERRLRHHHLKISIVETWRIEIEQGESFQIRLPKEVSPKPGDRLQLAAVLNEAPLRRKWRKVSSF
ncbi:MAG TPA: hypothetical protein VF662_03325 [Allosphingosinicella sp.]|jgi:hypothetical protein